MVLGFPRTNGFFLCSYQNNILFNILYVVYKKILQIERKSDIFVLLDNVCMVRVRPDAPIEQIGKQYEKSRGIDKLYSGHRIGREI